MTYDLESQLATFRSTHRQKRACFAGVQWSYIVGGSGPEPVLLLPGAPGIAEMAFPYIMAFERHFRVIALSYPAAVGSLEQLLAGIEDLVAAEADRPVHLIGASYSGLVAQHLTCRRKCPVASLLIGDTGVPRRDRAIAMAAALAIIARAPRLGLHAFLAVALTYVLKGDTQAHHFWRRYFKGIVAQLTVAEFVNRVRVMIEMDRHHCQDWQSLPWRGPTLLMETADDPLFSSVERAALRVRYPQAEVHTFYNRGHITALTRAPEYIAVMEGFLAHQR